ncbi:hypothetical protein TVAG_333000 [Trichomonas vaginalis G3]|uniref:Uncharacterized protein n=1 Tax=Trichomonas vaginalis (strain ATCC PRA-98 / G3) TaxID=412133 RepID=A2EH96_TRIV3|nr:hypothetical protein TVAGG3_0933750 [Trichomonas vaginalis G3]EAY07975.1 hypothetical protein TVAG_333000 [Trichomonas vaginalis G3]KAI5486021.1 hypothetical protein TVAGG3_0933750 [Trichomonas vaginalis G3]|eukprot:XP_001320198.1 hypothetical protein [Trichomonas vaginalis G3]
MQQSELPPEYNSTIKPKLDGKTAETCYQHCFGKAGQQIAMKSKPTTIRSLSKQTSADISGTPKVTYYPPGYTGYIPCEFKGNRSYVPREDRSASDCVWQYNTNISGYGGYVPSLGMDPDVSNVKQASTTYRDLCSAAHFLPKVSA